MLLIFTHFPSFVSNTIPPSDLDRVKRDLQQQYEKWYGFLLSNILSYNIIWKHGILD